MLGLWLSEQWLLAVGAVAVSALLGWPFAALTGLPLVLALLCRGWGLVPLPLCMPRSGGLSEGEWKRLVAYALLTGIPLCAVLATVDSHFYGKPVNLYILTANNRIKPSEESVNWSIFSV